MSGHLVDANTDSDFFKFFTCYGGHFLFSAMDVGNGESQRDHDPQPVTHLNLEPLSQSIYPQLFYIFLQVSSYVEWQQM